MKVNPGSVVVFPERYFAETPALQKLIITRLKINKQDVVGVHAKHFKEVCKTLKIPQNKVFGKRTQYGGVYLATIKESPAEEAKAAKQVMRQKYIEIASGPKPGRIKQLGELIQHQKTRIGALQVDLVKSLRDLEEKDQEYELIRGGNPAVLEAKGVEFDKLMAHPDVVDVSIKGNMIEILTGPIDIKHGGHVYSIGRFRIALPINPTHYIVKFYNLTREIQGCFHPHVHADGLPCLGNIQECLPSMVADRQFGAAISVCIQYLKSVNDGGHYAKITNWPIKKAREKREDGGKGAK